jgi:hypothetical protein
MGALSELIATHPGIARVLGRFLVYASGALALLGLRFDRLFHRLEVRGIARPTLETVLPGWLYWAVPESALGWFLLIAVGVGGFLLAHTAKRIRRALR